MLLLISCTNQESSETGAQATSAASMTADAEAGGEGQDENTANAGQESEDSGGNPGPEEGAEDDQNSESMEPDATPTAEPPPGKSLKVCLEGPAPSLYRYGDESQSALSLQHALSENLYTTAGYRYQAQGLEKMPSLADGDARRSSVQVAEGDRVVDVNGDVVSLRKGVTVYDATGEAVDFAGEPLEMEQLEVDFAFRPLVWSDGTPLSAVDSVFSFNVAADPRTQINKGNTPFTASYRATGDLTLRWTGLPGFLDQTYFTNVWSPLPAHALNRYTADELTTLEEVAKKPLSSGPYIVKEWPDENTIALAANPHYYRSGEGLPAVTNLTIQFGDLETLLLQETGCDVLAGGALGAHNLPELESGDSLDEWQILTSPGDVYEQIAFGIWPVFDYRERRPDWFGSEEVRQAIAMCTDRERMAAELTQERGEILNTLAPSDHPLAPVDLQTWAYDPAQGNAQLDAAGYLDFAEDGRRQDVASGVPMTVTLGTNSESALRLRITEIFEENMAECGIPVVRYDRPAGTWFGEGPQGPVFGRQFDLAALAWLGHVNPDCTIFTSDNITGPEDQDFAGWLAPNVSGWTNEAYDAACQAAVRALPGGEGYDENMREALRIFNEQLPALPLFTNYKAVAVRPDVLNVRPDPTQLSDLWNVAEWDVAE